MNASCAMPGSRRQPGTIATICRPSRLPPTAPQPVSACPRMPGFPSDRSRRIWTSPGRCAKLMATREDTMKTLHLISIGFAAVVACVLQSGIARAEIKTQWIDYKQGDTELRGYLAYDDAVAGKRPGVLLAHDRSGLSSVTIRDAEMIARLGYVVFAEDIFGKGIVPPTVPEMQATIAIYNKDRPLMRARTQAGFDVLRGNALVDASKLAVVGHCFGGTVAVELAEMGTPLAGMVSVHGSFRDFAPENAAKIKGRVLILHGAEDQVAPLDE